MTDATDATDAEWRRGTTECVPPAASSGGTQSSLRGQALRGGSGRYSTAASRRDDAGISMERPNDCPAPDTDTSSTNDSASRAREPAKRKPPSRAGKGPTPASWTPGRSGNPAGRPRGFAGVARLIAESTRDCAELVEWALEVWRDKKRPHAERAAAHQWLSDRGLGRPTTSAELTINGNLTATMRDVDVGLLTDAEVDQAIDAIDATLEAARQRALALPEGDRDDSDAPQQSD